MRPLRAQAVVLVVIVVLGMIIMLRAGLRRKTGPVRPIPTMNDSKTAADNGELPTEEARRVQTEAEQTDSATSTEVQTDTEATNAQTTSKPVNPAVELTLLRHTSVGKVRPLQRRWFEYRVPDTVNIECDLELLNPTPYRNKKHCCREAEKMALPELCGELNASSIRNESRVEGCTCTDLMACKAVVLTATSLSHWLESLDAIASVQNLMPDMKIVMMDLGMSAEQAEQLQQLHNVEVRKFPFDSFPPHVKRLKVFAWKLLSIQMMLSEFEVVFYMDASIRLRRPLVDILIPSVQNFPIKVNMNGKYDGAYTREETYKYLGVTRKQVSKRCQKEGGLQMYRNCSFLHERILSALVDCALHEECIAPSGASPSGCNMDKYHQQIEQINTIEQFEYIGCHRFDQSAMTAILEREFQFPDKHPVVSPGAFRQSLVVWRWPTKCFTLFLDN